MSGASIPPATQSIAAVLADVDGTLVTKKKALTPRAIEAKEPGWIVELARRFSHIVSQTRAEMLPTS